MLQSIWLFVLLRSGRVDADIKAKLVVLLSFIYLINSAFFVSSSSAGNIKIVNDRWPDTSTLQDFANSSINIMDAHTEEEKAIAIFRFIQQLTYVVNDIAEEPAYGNTFMINPEKELNIYTGHWCDGLARIMQMSWRALGKRANKLYRFGHTLADVYYEDSDGIGRWHYFDLSATKIFLYNREGTRLATPEELILDTSLSYIPSVGKAGTGTLAYPSYIHERHIDFLNYTNRINLRIDEKVTFLWGNVGKPYYFPTGEDVGGLDFEHGPYNKTYGNSIWEYSPELNLDSYADGAYELNNIKSFADDGLSPNLHASQPSQDSYIIYKFEYPYIISDSYISGKFIRNNPNDKLNIFISNDRIDWKNVWSADSIGENILNNLDISEAFEPNSGYPSGLITPFGHYDYYIKIEMYAAADISSVGINEINFRTITQNNIFALPQLWPVNNQISVNGLIDDSSLIITYRWDDLKGQNINKAIIEDTPFSYEILADGTSWSDIVCRNITVEAVSKIGNGNQVVIKEDSPQNLVDVLPDDEFDTMDIFGLWYPSRLKTTQEYIDDINNGLQSKNYNDVHYALFGLMVLRDPAAEEAIRNALYHENSYRYLTKYYALQALYLTIGDDALDTMIYVMKRDPIIKGWNDVKGEWDADTMWLWTCQLAAFMMADVNNIEARDNAYLITDLLNSTKLQHTLGGKDPNSIYRWSEIRWGLIKDLGILGSHNEVPILIDEIDDEWTGDNSIEAARALGMIGDASAVPYLIQFIERAEQQSSSRRKILYSIEALGNIGSQEGYDYGIKYLYDWDEDFRATCAEALGKIGDDSAIPYLQSLVKDETYPWVEEKAQHSIVILSGQTSTCRSGADTDNSDSVSMDELIVFIGGWKTGSVTIAQVLEAIGEWKNGC